MKNRRGIFITSLDLELYWGANRRDRISKTGYKGSSVTGCHIVPKLLELFDGYKIHATWAAVGFLFFRTRDELIKNLPDKKPDYANEKLSPYEHINHIGRDESADPYHYGHSLIRLISSYPYHEIATHTFSHYYCLANGQNIETFRADLKAAVDVARMNDVQLRSIVFPLNQINPDYLPVCREMGIVAYRGNPHSWFYRKAGENEKAYIRFMRLIDAYLNISGHNAHSIQWITKNFPFNIALSRFLRPYSRRLKTLESLRLKRIFSDLCYAAKNNLVYHLWWHPLNFERDLEENLVSLRKILDYYSKLHLQYGMESLNMGEVADRLLKEKKYE